MIENTCCEFKLFDFIATPQTLRLCKNMIDGGVVVVCFAVVCSVY